MFGNLFQGSLLKYSGAISFLLPYKMIIYWTFVLSWFNIFHALISSVTTTVNNFQYFPFLYKVKYSLHYSSMWTRFSSIFPAPSLIVTFILNVTFNYTASVFICPELLYHFVSNSSNKIAKLHENRRLLFLASTSFVNVAFHASDTSADTTLAFLMCLSLTGVFIYYNSFQAEIYLSRSSISSLQQ